MPSDRFFIDSTLENGGDVVVEGQEFIHLAKTMRTKEGDTVELVNGKGFLALATVASIGKRDAILVVNELSFFERPVQQVIIAQGMPRQNRLDIILEKGTELGMSALWLFPGDRSEKNALSDNQRRRIMTVMAAAMKQCGRVWLPDVIEMPPLRNWKDIGGALFFGDTDPAAPLFSTAWKKRSDGTVIFVVGPESGFSEKEESALKKMGARGVKLLDTILRTDTAPLMALSLVGHWLLSERDV